MGKLRLLQSRVHPAILEADINRYQFLLNIQSFMFNMVLIQEDLTPWETYEKIWKAIASKGGAVAPLVNRPSYELE